MKNMRELYLSCSTYFDVGDAVRWDMGLEQPPPQFRFKTSFIRPSKLHYQFEQDGWGAAQVWSNGASTFFVAFDDDEIQSAPSLQDGLKGKEGMGVADEVPRLLLPHLQKFELGDNSLIESVAHFDLVGLDSIAGEDCHHLQAKLDHSEIYVHLWISKTAAFEACSRVQRYTHF